MRATVTNVAQPAKVAGRRAATLSGPARLGKRTKNLVARLTPGAVAILDHADLDAVAARALARTAPAAVVNNRLSITGRYPNRGPGVLMEAGVPLYDVAHAGDGTTPDLFSLLREGETVSICDEQLLRADGTVVAPLEPFSPEMLRERLAAARANLDAELIAFAGNTLRYLSEQDERALLLDPVRVPEVRAPIAGRPVLVAVRGEHYEDDLRELRRYLREQRPTIIAVDGAADTLLAAGVRPDIILGDMDSVGDDALRSGAELVVHAYARPRPGSDDVAPGLARVQALGLDAHVFPVPGTSEDAALLLAYEKEADLIVAVGTHTNLEDFLDKGRGGMASTFLVRLKVGNRLVDARGVSRLYGKREKLAPLLSLLLLSALFPFVVLLAGTKWGQLVWQSVVLWFRVLFQ
uniref:FIG005773: conserved membrane protein ML1361 n=1 Tax=uncultured Armatimonadetes bacterium TaxID=157466 RepID=A0A6J4JR74_9BACT|nr:FIG005773: conserved membrane protein ML1361 [uncultured Armatimonadetes bacterium]